MLPNEPPAYGGGPAAGPPAADAGGPPVARWRRLITRRLAWEAWARAGVFLAITLRLDLRYVTALVRGVCVGVAYNLGLAARDSALVMLMKELHYETRRDEVLQQWPPSGREPEAPRSSGHWVPERVRRDAAQAAPPPVPVGAHANDDVAPQAAAQESGGGLPGTQAAALPPVRWGPRPTWGRRACSRRPHPRGGRPWMRSGPETFGRGNGQFRGTRRRRAAPAG